MGSRRNHVVKVNPFSCGHFASGGKTIAYREKEVKRFPHYSVQFERNVIILNFILISDLISF